MLIFSLLHFHTFAPRMLGYAYGQHTVRSFFGSVSSTFAMDNVRCTGNEASILDCPHLLHDDCDSSEGAGVICSNSPTYFRNLQIDRNETSIKNSSMNFEVQEDEGSGNAGVGSVLSPKLWQIVFNCVLTLVILPVL